MKNMQPARECDFKNNLDYIALCLKLIDRICPYEGHRAEESADRIRACCDHLPSLKAAELIHGLRELVNQLRARLEGETALIEALSDRNLVPIPILLKITEHKAVRECPSVVYDFLMSSIPEHQRPE